MKDDKSIYSQKGRVERGAELARVLGFPTANIPLNDPSVSGTYAGLVRIDEQDGEHEAAVYADTKRLLLEAHLFDFQGDLYGREITVVLCVKIAESEHIADPEGLRSHITQIVEQVREYFKKELKN